MYERDQEWDDWVWRQKESGSKGDRLWREYKARKEQAEKANRELSNQKEDDVSER